ncbi:MAG: hypothetical protein Q7K39_04385 [Candidatus Magasanikbacteria bacterium]|nr:hypothetical protein [Candidatus Magasanikbacteria bacterium]
MKQYFLKLVNRIEARVSHKRALWFLAAALCLALFVTVILPHQATAGSELEQLQTALSNPNWFLKIVSTLLLTFAQWMIRLALFFLAFIIQISAYNGYLDSTTVNIGWVMVRDITNMFFVVVLLIIAFGTILGIEQYEWKKLIVKFVLAAILVNFSRIICGLFIDASQIVMNTFVNGIVATAGGNLINMFNLGSIWRFKGTTEGSNITEPGVFTASVAAAVFAGMLMMTLAIFVFMLTARLVRLWVLIVLSPLAFVLSAIPLTQKFSSQWWTEFGDDLVTGPVLLFFIWLSFVSLTNGDVNSQIAAYSSIPDVNKIQDDATILGAGESLPGDFQSAGIGDSLKWNKMANFVIAIGMLLAGAQVASQIGGSSGSALTAVSSFGKKVATIATGYVAGRWLYEKGAGGIKAAGAATLGGLGFLATRAPILRLKDRWTMLGDFAKRQKAGYDDWARGGPRKKKEAVYQLSQKKVYERAEGGGTTTDEALAKKENDQLVQARDGKGKFLYETKGTTDIEAAKAANNGQLIRVKNDDGSDRYDFARKFEPVLAAIKDAVIEGGKAKVDEEGKAVYYDARGNETTDERLARAAVDKDGNTLYKNKEGKATIEKSEAVYETEDVAEEATDENGKVLRDRNGDKLYKTKDGKGTTTNREDARTIRQIRKEDVGYDFEEGKGSRGFFQRWANSSYGQVLESKKRLEKTENQAKVRDELMMKRTTGIPTHFFQRFEGPMVNAEDRIEQGELEAEGKRSQAKTREYKAVGEKLVLGNARFKDGRFQDWKESMADQIAGHEGRAEATEAGSKLITAAAKNKFAQSKKGQQSLQAKILADLRVKTQEAEFKRVEGEAMTQIATKLPEGLKEIVKTIESEKAAHLEEKKLETVKKEKEKEFFAGSKGQHELEEEAKLKARQGLFEKEISAMESEKQKDFAREPEGTAIIKRLADAEIEISTAENYGKHIKSEHVKEQFFLARKKMEDFKNGDDVKAFIDDQKQPVALRRYVEAAKNSALSANSEKLSALFKKDVESDSEMLLVDMKYRGYGKPRSGEEQYAKAESEDQARAGDEGRGDNLLQNWALVSKKRHDGKLTPAGFKSLQDEIDAEQVTLNGFATLLGTGRGCNVDDAVLGSAMKKFEILDTPAAWESAVGTGKEEQRQELLALRADWERMGIAKKNMEGKWTSTNSGDTNALLAYHTVSGGDTDLVMTHKKILDVAAADGTSYEDAQKKYFASAAPKIGAYQKEEDFKSFFVKHQGRLIALQDEFQRSGVQGGHFQQSGFMRRGVDGLMRFVTHAEQVDFERQQKKKNESVKMTPHAVSTMDGATGHKAIDEERFSTSNIVQVTTIASLNQRAQDRTKDLLSLDSELGKDGKVMLGGDAKRLKQIGEGDSVLGVARTIENFFATMEHQFLTVALANGARHGTKKELAEAGILNGRIEGTTIAGGGVDEVAVSMIKYIDDEIKQLKALATRTKQQEEALKVLTKTKAKAASDEVKSSIKQAENMRVTFSRPPSGGTGGGKGGGTGGAGPAGTTTTTPPIPSTPTVEEEEPT